MTSSDPASDSTESPLTIQGTRPDLGSLALGLVFVAFLGFQTIQAKTPSASLIFILGWIGLIQLLALLSWWRPPVLQLHENQLHLKLFPLQPPFITSVSNVAALGLLNRVLVVRFHQLEEVRGPAPGALKQMEATLARTGFHLQLPDGRFTRSQINTLREAMGCGPQDPTPSEIRTADFDELLEVQTPHPRITQVFLVSCIAVFVAMLVRDFELWNPKSEVLLAWGANYGPMTLGGQWWRLITYQFVHIGLLHLIFNMSVLRQVGPTVERLFGSRAFLVGTLFSGVCGGLASLAWPGPVRVSAGASGAIFGLIGMMMGLLVRHHGRMPLELVKQHRTSLTGFVLINALFGFSVSGIDLGAHLGGFAGGFVFGLIATPVFVPGLQIWKSLQALPLALACTAACAALFFQLQPKADLTRAMQKIFDAEHTAQESLERILTRLHGGLGPEEGSRAILRDVVEPWTVVRRDFEALPDLSQDQRDQYETVRKYLEQRETAWRRFADATRTNDLSLWGEGLIELEEALTSLRDWAQRHPAAGIMVTIPEQNFFGELTMFLARDARIARAADEASAAHADARITGDQLISRLSTQCLPQFDDAQLRFRKRSQTAAGSSPELASLISSYSEARRAVYLQQIQVLRMPDDESRERLREVQSDFERASRQVRQALFADESGEL